MRSSLIAVCLLCAACASQEPEAAPIDSSTGGEAQSVCEPGADQTCNDDPTISSLHGTCLPNGTCECAQGVEKNAATGRCR